MRILYYYLIFKTNTFISHPTLMLLKKQKANVEAIFFSTVLNETAAIPPGCHFTMIYFQ
jgi:hypothetical protein